MTLADKDAAEGDVNKNAQIAAHSVIDAYFGCDSGRQLVKHQLDSFDDFASNKIEQIIEGFNPVEIHHDFIPERGCFRHVLSIRIDNPILSKPTIIEKDGSSKVMLPNDARLRNLTYAAPLSVDMTITSRSYDPDNEQTNSETRRIPQVSLGRVPVMVRSQTCMLGQQVTPCATDECMHDHGGYFVVNGNEKVLISQDRIAENRTYVFPTTKLPSYALVAEIRSVPEDRFGVPKTTMLKLTTKATQYGRCIRVGVHHIKHDVPVAIMFRALGVLSDMAILQHIVYDVEDDVEAPIVRAMAGSIDEGSEIRTQEAAMDYLVSHLQLHGQPRELSGSASHKNNVLRGVIRRELLPHVGNDHAKKALYMGYMVRKLLASSLGVWEFDDRDSYINKRLDTPGILMANLFRQYYGRVIKDIRNQVQKDINGGVWRATNRFINVLTRANVFKVVKSTVIESGLKYGLSTGNWGVKTARMRQGVAQVLNRMSYVSTVSHLRRINTPIEKTGKLVQPRKLHPTQFGIICPSETPEGASVGLVKNLALMCNISVTSPSSVVRGCLEELGVVLFTESSVPSMFAGRVTKVFVNGDIVGTHALPSQLHADLVERKRAGQISVFTSVAWHVGRNEVQVCTEGGRFLRPVVIVENGHISRLDGAVCTQIVSGARPWHDLVVGSTGKSVIEFLDVIETNHAMIAMRHADLTHGARGAALPVEYTHVEIDPTVMLGVVAGSIPFSDHNQAPRNTYQSAMGKQAIGIYATNIRHRFDSMAHVLSYPQRPLVATRTARILNCDTLPCGVNTIVAIACYTGFNQEDSVIINKSAVERGLFGSTYYRTHRDQCGKNHSTGEEEFFTRPDPTATRSMKPHSFAHLAEDGFVPENAYVRSGDVIIGKCMPQKIGQVTRVKDCSTAIKGDEVCAIDRNCHGNRYFTNVTGDGYTFAKVRTRSSRVPMIGDKFSSRHGQKGTLGMLYAQEDMPFTVDGIVPDIIMNPHAVPSRMTIGQLMECILGKACLAAGELGDASPFTSQSVDAIGAQLMSRGLHRHADEIMMNPRTGEQITTAVFIGPTFYQRLKHMTCDKVHSRAANGPVVLLTRQPAEGRARDGGLRLGEMELDCIWSHGAMSFLKERFVECSDNYRVFVCRRCGMMANVNPERNIHSCRACKNTSHFSELRIPYSAKLLVQEIQSMNIATRFITAAT